jgi:beta-glucosidase
MNDDASEAQRIEYVGSATSHFQSDPLLLDDAGQPYATSDWEHELIRRLQGKHTKIPKADIRGLPRFLALRNLYIERSAYLSENMFRLSFDFPRLCPRPGEFNYKLMAEYARTLILIRAAGIEPLVTLEHFTAPLFLTAISSQGEITAGAWENPDITKHLRFYVENVVRFLSNEALIHQITQAAGLSPEQQLAVASKGLVRYFLTINEPATVLYNGYVSGAFPPFKRLRLVRLLTVLKRLVQAHDIATTVLKEGLRHQWAQPQVGVTYNWQSHEGVVGAVAQAFQEYCTRSFEHEGSSSDFLGLDYYFRYKFLAHRQRREYGTHPSFGDIYPKGISEVLAALHSQFKAKPIFITEFGFADSNDLRRPYWILETVRYILEAKETGIPIQGVLLWTLVNNFEWELGMSPKFGLFDEAELDKLPIRSMNGIRSSEAWCAAIERMRAPGSAAVSRFNACFELAKTQYKEAGGLF